MFTKEVFMFKLFKTAAGGLVILLALNATAQTKLVMSSVASPQSAGTPFMLTLTALTAGGSTNTSYQSPVSLTAVGSGGVEVFQPTNVRAWINGVWIGGVQVDKPDTNVRLIASDGVGHSVTGNVFNVQAGSLDHFAFKAIPSPQHEAVPFPVTITAEDAGNNPVTNFTGSAKLAAFAGTGSSNIIFSANFEDGLDGFTIDNTIGAANGNSNGLWHFSIGQATNGNHSAYHSLYYGQGETLSGGGNYNTGYTSEGVVTSPAIDLTGQTTPVTLSFKYFLESEYYYYYNYGPYDYAWVEISTNGGPFTSLTPYLYPTAYYYNTPWVPISVDLSSYVGSQIQIRFHFISDSQLNNYQGWYVDDMVVSGVSTAPAPLSLNPTNTTAFVAGTWTGAVAVLDAFTNVIINAADSSGHSGNSPGFAVRGNADLAVSIFSSPDTIQAPGSVTFVVFVTNSGPERASFVTLNDPLPPNVVLTYAEVSQGYLVFNNNNNVLTCSFGGLDPGDFAIAVMIAYPQVKMLLTNTVTASTAATDTNQANNTASAVTTVNGEGILYVYGSDFLPYSADGGPFNTSGQYYYLQNNGTAPLNWSASSSATWMSITPTSGTLSPGASTNVFVSTNATAASLPAGVYSNTIVFANTTDGNGTATFNGVLALYQSHLTVNADQPIRTADARWFGMNTAAWDTYFDTPTTLADLREVGCQTLRFPGGSLSDDYHWATGQRDDNPAYPYDTTRFTNFMHIATNLGAQVFITVNYGSGTTNEAAAWVACANVTNHCGFKYWEVGNECYGTWERDLNTNAPYMANDPWTYAMRFRDYYTAMKAVDPTIKVGIVAVPGEDSFVNNYTHSAYNQREGYSHNGWTPVMLSTLQSLGITPDFMVHHFYPEYQSDNDANLLQAASNWAVDAADLRQQISDYFGGNGTNIELVCTENNADAGAQGRQSTSLVNGLYLADSLSQLMKTEFNSYIWWDLRNGQDTGGDFNSSLYGWRTYGDLGMILNSNTRYPTFYAMKLMQHFAQPGDTVITAASDYALLSTYAVRRLNGSLTILAVNKDPSNTITAPVVVADFTPVSRATVYSYGIPQDNAAKTGIGSPDIAQTNFTGAGTNFSYAFPPYSATVLALSPAPAQLLVIPIPPAQSKFVFQLQGQSGVPYIIQRSTNLVTWTSISTNTLLASTLNITNLLAPSFPLQFWRAVWQP
jgi:alpha-N-arabinofuranosidase